MAGGKNDNSRTLFGNLGCLIGVVIDQTLTTDFAAHFHLTIQCDLVIAMCKFWPLMNSGDFEILLVVKMMILGQYWETLAARLAFISKKCFSLPQLELHFEGKIAAF